ncbi:MAG: Uma2 family endonuclease [Nodosilinea sp.]
MKSNRRYPYFTPDEYLAIERISPIKHEYLQGQILAIAGSSKVHSIIVGNLSALLVNSLKEKPCLSYASSMKIFMPELDIFYYSDLAVTCDERDHASQEDFILHPKLIVEVLSDSTEAFDRGEKFASYKAIPELEEYILIHQKQVIGEKFQRKPQNVWVPSIYRENDSITLDSIGFTCKTQDLYANLEQLT